MPPPDDTIGKNIAGKYRVEQMIGEGGMGKVYKATQLALDKPVVLKVLRQALLGDERTVARFQREAKAASRLNHPDSVGVIGDGTGNDDGTVEPAGHGALAVPGARSLHVRGLCALAHRPERDAVLL